MDIIDKLHQWTTKKKLARFNMNHSLCKCPYCMQYAETGQEQFAAWSPYVGNWRDSFTKNNDYIVLTCGPCGGTSLWIEIYHMFVSIEYVCPLEPPKGKPSMMASHIPPDLKKKMAMEALTR